MRFLWLSFYSYQSNGFSGSLPQTFPGQRNPVFNLNVVPYEFQYVMNRPQPFQYVNGLQIPTNQNPSRMWTNAALTPQPLPRFTFGQNSMSNGFQFPGNTFGFQPQTQINQSPGHTDEALISTLPQRFSGNRNSNWMGRQIESTPLVQQPQARFGIRQPTEQMPDHQKPSVQTPVFYRHISGASNVNQGTTFLHLDVPMARYFWQSNPNVPQPPQNNFGAYNRYSSLFGPSNGRTQTGMPRNVNNPGSPTGLNPPTDTNPSVSSTIPRTRNILIPNYNFPSQTSRYLPNIPDRQKPGLLNRGVNYPSNVPVAPQPGQVGQGLHFPSNVPVAPQPGQVGQGLHFPSNVPVAPQPGQVGQGLHFPSNVPVAPQPGQVGQGLQCISTTQVGQGLHFPSNVPVAPQPGQVNPGLQFPSNVPVAPQPIIPRTRTTPSPSVPTKRFSSCPALEELGEHF